MGDSVGTSGRSPFARSELADLHPVALVPQADRLCLGSDVQPVDTAALPAVTRQHHHLEPVVRQDGHGPGGCGAAGPAGGWRACTTSAGSAARTATTGSGCASRPRTHPRPGWAVEVCCPNDGSRHRFSLAHMTPAAECPPDLLPRTLSLPV